MVLPLGQARGERPCVGGNEGGKGGGGGAHHHAASTTGGEAGAGVRRDTDDIVRCDADDDAPAATCKTNEACCVDDGSESIDQGISSYGQRP